MMTQMSVADKVRVVKTMLKITGDAEDTRIMTYLDVAGREILAWRYSLTNTTVEEVPAELEMVQIYAVLAGLGQAGAEGQHHHHENGVNIVFDHDSMVNFIRAKVTPYCKVL